MGKFGANLRQISGRSRAHLGQLTGKSLANLRQILGKSWTNLRHISGKSSANLMCISDISQVLFKLNVIYASSSTSYLFINNIWIKPLSDLKLFWIQNAWTSNWTCIFLDTIFLGKNFLGPIRF